MNSVAKFAMIQIVLSTCILSRSIAQKNNIEVSVLPRVWLNQYDVQHDDFENNALSADNRIAYGADVSYRRSLSSNFNVGASVGYGRYSDKVNVKYSITELRDLRQDGKFNLAGAWNGIYQSQTGYFSLSLFGGYKKHFKNSNWLGIDLGLRKLFLTYGDAPIPVTMYADIIIRDGFEFGQYYWGGGNMGKQLAGPLLADLSFTYNFKLVNKSFFVGLTGTICPSESLNGQNIYSTLKDYKVDANGNKVTVAEGEKIVPKYASIGLKLGMDLFRF